MSNSNKKKLFIFFFLLNICCYNLWAFDFTVKVKPEVPTIFTKIEITASIQGGQGMCEWVWIINKEPNDFGDYPGDSSKQEIKKIKCGNICVMEFNRTKPGVYKVYLSVVDARNKQGSLTYYIPIIESDGILSSIYMYDYDIDSIMEVQIGSRMIFHDKVSLRDFSTENSRYDGIYKIQWDTGTQKEYTFNTICELQEMNYMDYYLGGNFPIYVKMDREGEYSVKLNAWGGKFGYLLGQRKNPLKMVSSGYNSQAVKKIKVVDCSRTLIFNNLSEYQEGHAFKEIHSSVKIDNNKSYNLKSYSQITLENGFCVKEGSSFTAKIIPTPPFIYSNNSFGYPTLALTKGLSSIARNDDVCNITINQVTKNVMIEADDIIKNIFIFSMNGKIVKSYSGDLNNIDISFLPKGLYIFKIVNEHNSYSKKIIIE